MEVTRNSETSKPKCLFKRKCHFKFILHYLQIFKQTFPKAKWHGSDSVSIHCQSLDQKLYGWEKNNQWFIGHNLRELSDKKDSLSMWSSIIRECLRGAAGMDSGPVTFYPLSIQFPDNDLGETVADGLSFQPCGRSGWGSIPQAPDFCLAQP